MGYGQKLNEHIQNTPGMNVSKLARLTGISPSTLYSIIKRDTAIRFDMAVRIANVLEIDVAEICKLNPFGEEGEVSPDLFIYPEFLAGKYAEATEDHFLKPILMVIGMKEAPNVEQLLTSYAKLTDDGRKILFDSLIAIEKIATDPERAEKVAKNVRSFKKKYNNKHMKPE